jgi:hypothetical protein
MGVGIRGERRTQGVLGQVDRVEVRDGVDGAGDERGSRFEVLAVGLGRVWRGFADRAISEEVAEPARVVRRRWLLQSGSRHIPSMQVFMDIYRYP